MKKHLIHYYYVVIVIPYLKVRNFWNKLITAIRDGCWHSFAMRKLEDGWDQHYCPKCGKDFGISQLGKWRGISIVGIRKGEGNEK